MSQGGITVTLMSFDVASSPGLPRLLIAASDLKTGRPGRFCDVTLRWWTRTSLPANQRLSYSIAL